MARKRAMKLAAPRMNQGFQRMTLQWVSRGPTVWRTPPRSVARASST